MTRTNSGFTLVEVVVASTLLCVLVAASYIAISSVSHASHLMSQRVTAQSTCITFLEFLKTIEYKQLENNYPKIEMERQRLIDNGLGPGSANMELEYNITPVADDRDGNTIKAKKIKIEISWDFTDRFYGSDNVGRRTPETLWALITDSYSILCDVLSPLHGDSICLNPNTSLPSSLYVIDVDGNEYTEKDLKNGNLSGTVYAKSISFFPGGGGVQENKFSNKELKINNAKTYTYYSTDEIGDQDPLILNFSQGYENGDRKYNLSINCSRATAITD